MRLIDADRLFDAMRRIEGQFFAGVGEVVNIIDVFEQIKDAPNIDAVEVVRCGECKYRHDDECPMRYVEWVTYDDDGYIEWDDVVHDYTMDDGFCNCGEREYG